MALVMDGESCCPICDKPVYSEVGYFATSGVFFDIGHPLERYCDAAIHWGCFISWDMRAQFCERLFESRRVATIDGGRFALAYCDYMFFVSVDFNFYEDDSIADIYAKIGIPYEEDTRQYLHISLKESGSELKIDLDKWEQLIETNFNEFGFWHDFEKQAFFDVLPILKKVIPTKKTILKKADFKHAKRVYNQERRSKEREKKRIKRELERYNKKAEKFYKKGLSCIHCGDGDNIRFVDGTKTDTFKKSYFICNKCGLSFRFEDLRAKW